VHRLGGHYSSTPEALARVGVEIPQRETTPFLSAVLVVGEIRKGFKNARALRLRFSQSLARRRHRLSLHEPFRLIGSSDDFDFETGEEFGERAAKNRPLIGTVGKHLRKEWKPTE
jgi:hypothetical protein